MSSERDRQSVLRTTKVRTALKGDSSWIQRSKGFEPEEDEKPCAKTPSSGYLIRGVFTKTETKSTQPSSANGHIGTSGFVKKASDGYKKIAPHTVRSNIETTERSEPSLSTEEQDKRTEAASSCLRNSAARQRSYVLSAAKKYESSEKPDGSAPTVTSFVAKRVVINEDEDSNPVEPNAETPVSPSSSGLVAQQSYSVEISVDEPAPPITAVGKKVPSPAPELKPEATPTKSDHILYATYDTSEPTSVWKPDAQFTPAPEAKNVSFTTPETKTEPTLKTSVTEGNAQVIKAPVLKKASSATPEPKPESAPKPSVTEPVTPIAPVAQKDTTKTPKPESTPKQSFTESINPTAPLAQKDSSKTLEPKPQPTPKPSVTEPVAPSTPVAQKGISKIPEPKPQPTPKPSVTEPIIPTVPVAQKDISKTLETKPESTPKPSVTEPTIPAAPVAQKDISKTPEPKPQPTPKPSVTEPVAPSTHVAQKDISKRPEPKPQPTPKPSLTEAVTPTVPVAQKDIFKTLETKPESTPKPSVTELITPATLVAQKGPYKTSEPKQEITPKKSVKTLQKTSDLNDIDLLDLTQSTLQKQVDLNPTTTDLLTGIGSSLPQSEKTRGSLDLLALDVIPIDTNSDKLSTDKLHTKDETTKTVVWSKDPRSSTEMVTITTNKTEIVKGSALRSEYSAVPQSEKTWKSLDLLAKDVIPFDTDMDDYNKTQSKIETSKTVMYTKKDSESSLPQSEKTQESLDLLTFDVIPSKENTANSNKMQSKVETSQTIMYTKNDSKSSLPQSEKTQESLDLLAFDVIPNKENIDKPKSDKTQSEVETSQTVMLPKDSKGTMERFDPIMLDSQKSKKQTLTYETKESDSGSPWDEWTSSTVYTTIKKSDMKADPQPMADSYTYSRVQDSPAQESRSLDADTKRSFVYVKEYVNLSELSTQNDVRDGDYLSSTTSRYAYSSPSSDGDYLTSTISRYAYSSPSSVNATACTYCGRLVGNDAKITIEHLNISCHPDCFKCGICSKPMGDFLDNMFLHRGTVHCESCYANVH
ncbi:zinc finger protein 185 isoform X8 [Electrophorus electricus]|uniref:zinc finger protein 185 isoform X8 n=1 Tax=Electrophorus electricus TaxID=8005 RepID=UPI0015CFA2AA|nr:zinc finger protein 185 isoform X8 [Electrophorus electricus]